MVSDISAGHYGIKFNLNCSAGGLLIGRTIAVLLTMTLSTSLVAREGPVPTAGHQLCLQVWLTISLLNDALALAGQVCTFIGHGI
jgi:Na+-driven multidrug efflux pump